MRSSSKQLRSKFLNDARVKKAYDSMTLEFQVARAFIAARVKAGLTQEQVAKRMGTTRSVVARFEAGSTLPSIKSIYRYAEATGTRPKIRLVDNKPITPRNGSRSL